MKENKATPKVTFGFLRDNAQTGNKARSVSLRIRYNRSKGKTKEYKIGGYK